MYGNTGSGSPLRIAWSDGPPQMPRFGGASGAYISSASRFATTIATTTTFSPAVPRSSAVGSAATGVKFAQLACLRLWLGGGNGRWRLLL